MNLQEKKARMAEKIAGNLKESTQNIGVFSLNSADEKTKYFDVEIERITKSFEFQARLLFDDENISKIASSIEKNGFIQNIILVEIENGEYMIVAGETRIKAAKRAGEKVVKACVFPFGTKIEKLLRISVGENANRVGISLYESYRLFQKLLSSGIANTYGDIERVLDKAYTASYIKKAMSFHVLPPEIHADAEAGILNNTHVVGKMRAVITSLMKSQKLTLLEAQSSVLEVYEEAKKNKLTNSKILQMLDMLSGKQEKKIVLKKDRMIVNIEGLSEDQITQLVSLVSHTI